jgi:predicted lipoprotein with Yx(FWY)xxD motif
MKSASEQWWRLARFSGSALLVATGAIHLDLYLTGYSTIPTIGWLFLLQVISDFALAILLLEWNSRLISAAGAGLFVSTLVGYILALRVGLFGFREVRTTAGIAAGVIEIVGFAALAAYAVRPFAQSPTTPEGQRVMSQTLTFRLGRWSAVVLTALAALSFGLSLPNADAAPATTGRSAVVKVTTIHGVSVLTNAHGDTLYWFAPDTSTVSHCYGTCAAYWPPLTGTPVASSGVTGSLTTLKRSGGALQVTYNGHPLYTYVGDSAPGQNSGNRIHLNGGEWYEMKAST